MKPLNLLTGRVRQPLHTGDRAVIFTDPNCILTTPVSAIRQITSRLIWFETMEAEYCVRPHPDDGGAMSNAKGA